MPDPLTDNEYVEMRPAHEWTCPRCGTDHFAKAVVMEMDDETRREMHEDHGIPPESAQTGQWLTCPREVECPDCKQVWPAKDMEEDDDAAAGY